MRHLPLPDATPAPPCRCCCCLLLQVPGSQYRAEPWAPAAAVLVTGDDQAAVTELAGGMFSDSVPDAAAVAAAQAALAASDVGAGNVNAAALSLLGLVYGTNQSEEIFFSYYLEPAFVPSETVGCRCGAGRRAGALAGLPGRLLSRVWRRAGWRARALAPSHAPTRPPTRAYLLLLPCLLLPPPPPLLPPPPATVQYNVTLFNMVADASSPSAVAVTNQLAAQLSNFTFGGGGAPSVSAVTGLPVWQANASDINRQLYCGYSQASAPPTHRMPRTLCTPAPSAAAAAACALVTPLPAAACRAGAVRRRDGVQ